jgi:PAS domain S-box-containing protein
MHPDEIERNGGLLMKLVENPGSSVTLTLRIKHKDGTWRWSEATSTSQLHNPVVNGVVSNFRDVTEKFMAEQALRDSEQRFRTLIENNKDVIALTAPDGSITYMSPSVKNMLGYTPEELVGTSAINIMHPDEIQFNLGQLMSLVENPGTTVFKVMRLQHKSGEWRWIEATTTSHLDSPNIRGMVSNFRDVTERKKAEEELEQLNISLEQKIHERTIELQESNKALKSFSSIAAHDLQSPLRIMSGYASIIMDDYKDKLGPEGYELFKVIVKESKHMSQLINDLLNFSSMSYRVLSKEQVDFDTMVAEVTEDVRLSEENTKAQVRIGSLGTCMSDKTLIRQVWINLISNAFKYSSKKEDPQIEIGCMNREGEKIYFVKDNGTGFNMAYVSKLFNLFKRLHTASEFKGTGIGLAIVSNIIQRHDGRIWTEAEEGSGATFYFTLPE